jgi:hypothetical protein
MYKQNERQDTYPEKENYARSRTQQSRAKQPKGSRQVPNPSHQKISLVILQTMSMYEIS